MANSFAGLPFPASHPERLGSRPAEARHVPARLLRIGAGTAVPDPWVGSLFQPEQTGVGEAEAASALQAPQVTTLRGSLRAAGLWHGDHIDDQRLQSGVSRTGRNRRPTVHGV